MNLARRSLLGFAFGLPMALAGFQRLATRAPRGTAQVREHGVQVIRKPGDLQIELYEEPQPYRVKCWACGWEVRGLVYVEACAAGSKHRLECAAWVNASGYAEGNP